MIVIVASAEIGFPGGMAAVGRITNYARGLIHSGFDVLVLCLGPSEPSREAAVNRDVRGVYRGISFEYTCGSTVRSSSFWRRRWSRVVGLLGAARRIRRTRAGGPVEAILLYSQRSLDAAFFHFVARQVDALYVAEVGEIPYQSFRPGPVERLRLSIFNRTYYRWFDACIAISEHLRRYATHFGRPGMAAVTVPIIVDCDDFQPTPIRLSLPKVVMYCGQLNEEKDGVVSLMKAFRDVALEVDGLRLVIVGDEYVTSRVPEFRAIAKDLGISDQTTFAGRVQRSEVPGYLAQASVLVLARPRSLQADAGMPSKVAEYLASGVPTILTRTGELAGFLEDGVSAYLIPPNDVPALSEAIRHVLLSDEEAAAVGRRGRELAFERFDYRVVGAMMAEFISEHTPGQVPMSGVGPSSVWSRPSGRR